ncbi:MAG TPA: GAF domain-containing sensor histidine kinase [Candidatus Gastranaerophilales bacterium]|nr:GAF domain-containing sensor histidine kinase [Candidatus Gastranaerophilales bacterium]
MFDFYNKFTKNIQNFWKDLFFPEICNVELMQLIDIINKFIDSLDSTLLKTELVNFIGNLFQADICFIDDYDKKDGKFIKTDYQFISSQSLKSFMDVIPEASELMDQLLLKEEIVIYNPDSFLEKNNLLNTKSSYFLKYFKIKSAVYIPIKYKNNIEGLLGIVYVKKNKYFKEIELELIRKFAFHIAIALYHIKHHSTLRECLKREIITRRVIEASRKVPDLKKIKQQIVRIVGKSLKADRCFFRTYDKLKKRFLKADVEYKCLTEFKSVMEVEPDIEGLQYFYEKTLTEKVDLITIDYEEDIVKKNLQESPLGRYLKNLDIKIDYTFPIWDKEDNITYLVLHYIKEPIAFSFEDIDFAKILTKQIANVIDYSILYQNLKLAAEREKILRESIEITRSSLDIKKTKNFIVTTIGEMFKADRCFIRDYDFNLFLPPEPDAEYLSSEDITKASNYCILPDVGIEISNILFSYTVFTVINDTEKFIEENNFKNTYIEQMINIFSIKSGVFNLILSCNNETLGFFAIHYTKEKRIISNDDIKFIKVLIDQLAIAIYQAKFYEKEKQLYIREKLLREITETIRSSLDINEIKKNITESFGKAFNLDRCFILSYNPAKDTYSPLDEYSEYRSSDQIKSIVGFDFSDKDLYFFVDLGKKNIDTYGTCAEKDFVKKYERETTQAIINYFNEFEVKSCFQVSIFYTDQFLGLLVGHNISEREEYSQEEKLFIKSLANQSSIALHHAELYEQEEKTLERERLLRKITETIRTSLDINETLTIICDEVGKSFNAGRTSIIQFSNPKDYTEWTVKREYQKKEEYKSIKDLSIDKKIGLYLAKMLFDEKTLFLIENISESDIPDLLKEAYTLMGLKTIIGVSIAKDEEKWGGLFLSEYDYYRHWSKEDISLLKTIADQVFIAIKQAELYENTKQSAERERALRSITYSIRSYLDIKEIQTQIVNLTGRALNANRCIIVEFDRELKRFKPIKYEYLSSSEEKSLVGFNAENELPLISDLIREKKEILAFDFEEYYKNLGLEERPEIKKLKEQEIKTDIAMPILCYGNLYGTFVIHYTKEKRFFTEEDLNFVRTITAQAGIALYQAELYEKEKLNTEKERILKELLAEIKLSLKIDDLYNHALIKTAYLFNADRSFFLELPYQEDKSPLIKYEYLKNEDLKSFKKVKLPEDFINLFKPAIEKLKPVFIENLETVYSENQELKDFLNQYQIYSIMLVPFVKINMNVKIFGIMALTSSTSRLWTHYEREVLAAIAETSVRIIWEISKREELEEVKNTFIMTLAHDLQIPIIAEQKALEFLLKRPEEANIGKYKEFMQTMAKDNLNVLILLKNLLEIYKFESGKKLLKLGLYNLSEIVKEVVDALNEQALAKSISITMEIAENLPEIYMDKEEIKKVASIIFENAIIYIQKGGSININIYQKSNKIYTEINDNGPGIPVNIVKALFQRYVMTEIIERRIGSGLNLYLAKLIIEAHKGKIWFDTEPGQGTTFYFYLPTILERL